MPGASGFTCRREPVYPAHAGPGLYFIQRLRTKRIASPSAAIARAASKDIAKSVIDEIPASALSVNARF